MHSKDPLSRPDRQARRFPFIFKPRPKSTIPRARTTLVSPLSPIEMKFWQSYLKIRPRALRGLVCQYPVARYRIDFALPKDKIGIELDGWATHSSTTAIAADRIRQRDLESKGWYIIRFGGLEVHQNADACVRQAAHLVTLHRTRKRLWQSKLQRMTPVSLRLSICSGTPARMNFRYGIAQRTSHQ